MNDRIVVTAAMALHLPIVFKFIFPLVRFPYAHNLLLYTLVDFLRIARRLIAIRNMVYTVARRSLAQDRSAP